MGSQGMSKQINRVREIRFDKGDDVSGIIDDGIATGRTAGKTTAAKIQCMYMIAETKIGQYGQEVPPPVADAMEHDKRIAVRRAYRIVDLNRTGIKLSFRQHHA